MFSAIHFQLRERGDVTWDRQVYLRVSDLSGQRPPSSPLVFRTIVLLTNQQSATHVDDMLDGCASHARSTKFNGRQALTKRRTRVV